MSRTFFAAAVLCLTATGASAHHAFAAEYDENKCVTVAGTVTGLEWVNPHVWMHVSGKDENGRAAEWSFEMGAPGGLVRRGWTRTALKVGDPVTAQGYAAKDGRRVANAAAIRLPDGRKLFGGFQSTPRHSCQASIP